MGHMHDGWEEFARHIDPGLPDRLKLFFKDHGLKPTSLMLESNAWLWSRRAGLLEAVDRDRREVAIRLRFTGWPVGADLEPRWFASRHGWPGEVPL